MINAQSLTLSVINTQVNSMPLNEEFAQRGTLELKYNGGDERHQYMMPSELNFSMEVSDAADLHFDHLFTGNETNYQVVLTNENGLVIWRGHLLPEQYEEPYEHALLYVNFTATDGLARLKGKTLSPGMYTDRYSVIRFIYDCLKQTNLEQEILFAPAIKNDSPDIGSDWNKILIDGSVYASDNGKQDDCYKILESLLETLGCSLFSYMDKWYITGHNRYAIEDGAANTIEYYRYSVTGEPLGMVNLTINPTVINLEATPQISLNAPFKQVNVNWDIDEPNSILPEDIITQPFTTSFQWQNPPPVRHWVTSAPGLSIRREVLTDPKLATSGSFLFVGSGLTEDEIERRRNLVSATLFVSLNNYGTTLIDNTGYYMELEEPIYLKSEPDSIDIEMTMVGKFGYINNSGPFPAVNEDDYGNDQLNYEIVYDGEPLISNLSTFINRDAYLLDISYEGESISSQASPKRIVGKLSLKDMVLPYPGGMLQLRIYAMGGAANNIKGVTVGCRNLSINYTADKEHVYGLSRDIDWTTDIDIDITHGGNRNDISDTHFTLQNGDANDSNYTAQDVIGTGRFSIGFVPPNITFYDYIEVTSASFTALQNAVNNGLLIYGLPLNQSTYKEIKTDYSGVFGFQMFKQDAGKYYVFLEYVDSSPFLYFNIGPTLFKDGLFIYNDTVAVPDIDRAFREQWSRMVAPVSQEGKRYGEVRGQLVHDTQAAPLVSFDSNVFGLLDPWSVKRFNIKGDKNFLLTDLTLQLDQGMSNVTVIELQLDTEVETDYVLRVDE